MDFCPRARQAAAGSAPARGTCVVFPMPVASWLRHPLRLNALSRIAARASHDGEEDLLCGVQSCSEDFVLRGYVFYVSINNRYLFFEGGLLCRKN